MIGMMIPFRVTIGCDVLVCVSLLMALLYLIYHERVHDKIIFILLNHALEYSANMFICPSSRRYLRCMV